MVPLCECPKSALDLIPEAECKEDFGVVRRLAFSRKKLFQGVTSPATTSTIIELAEWANTLAATDDTLTIVTPLIDNVISTPGDHKTQEVSQRTEKRGLLPTMIDAIMLSAKGEVIEAFKKLQCEKVLYVYFFNEDEQIICADYGTDGPGGFKLSQSTFGMQDTVFDGTTPDSDNNALQFQLKQDWSDKKTVLDANFDPLTELSNGSS